MARGGPAPRTESCCSASRSRRGGAEKICPRSRPVEESRTLPARSNRRTRRFDAIPVTCVPSRRSRVMRPRKPPPRRCLRATEPRAVCAAPSRSDSVRVRDLSESALAHSPGGMDTAKSLYKGGKARVLGLDGKTSIFDHGKVGHTRGSRARRVRAADLGARARARLRRSRPPPSSLPRRPTTSRRPRRRSSRCVPGRTIAPRAGCVFARRKAVERPRFFEPRATPPPPERNAPATGSRGTRRRARVLPPAPSTIVPAPPLDAPARASPRASPPPRASTPRI